MNLERNQQMEKKPLVVTTEHRGVFFGWGVPTKDKTIELTKAQMCVYWSSDIGGVLGLASSGPSGKCRISPAIPKITLQAVTSVMEASKEAVKAWEQKPWA